MELYSTYIILSFVTVGTSLITLFTGFGVGTIMMPVLALFFDVKVAIFLAAIVHFFNNIFRIVLYRSAINWQIIKRFGMVSIIGAFCGSYGQLYLASVWLKIGVGVFLILYAMLLLFPKQIHMTLPDTLDRIGGFLSGLLGGLIGNQGAIRSLYLLNYQLEMKEFIASSALIASIIDITRIPLYAYANFSYLTANGVLLLCIILSSMLGTIIGSRIVPKVSYERFKKIIVIGILILGVLMVFKAV